jgi:hypothetical protein
MHPLSPITRIPSNTAKPDQPYNLNLPFGIHSILKNGPLPREIRSAVTSSPRCAGTRRVFFPAPKRVCFRKEPDLEEEVVTEQYTMRHADLNSEEDGSSEEGTEGEESSSTDDDNDGEESSEGSDRGTEKFIKVDELSHPSPRRRKRKMVSASSTTRSHRIGNQGEDGSRSTPRKLMKRKRRRWEWTLDSKKPETDVNLGED